MSFRLRIRCINKSDRFNPHERIKFVGGINSDGSRWSLSQSDAITAVEKDNYQFFVVVGSYEVDVVVAVNANGNKYLKTKADGHGENNLLSLPECP